jgi:single-strand DNA-binding protein
VIRSYDDKDGNKRKATEVVIDNMQMLGSRQGGGSEEGGGYNGGRSAVGAPASGGGNDSFDDNLDDEIPF